MTKKTIDERVNRLFLDLNQGMEAPIGNSPPVHPAIEKIEIQAQPDNAISKTEDEDNAVQNFAFGVDAQTAPADFEAQDRAVVPQPINKKIICPYLKAHWDETITYGYPIEENYCYRPPKAQAVSLRQQEMVCLSGQFQGCPVYLQIHVEDRLPEEIRPQIPAAKWKKILIVSIPPILILFLFAAMVMRYIK